MELNQILAGKLNNLLINLRTLQISLLLPQTNQTPENVVEKITHLKKETKKEYADEVLKIMTEQVAKLEKQLSISHGELGLLLMQLDKESPPSFPYTTIYGKVLAVRLELTGRIAEIDPRFQGYFKDTGSTAYNVVADVIPDFDMEFVLSMIDLNNGDFTVIQIPERKHGYRIQVVTRQAQGNWSDLIDDDGFLIVLKVNWRFFQLVAEALRTIRLPTGITYGGFMRPYFSGVQEATTNVNMQLLYDGNKKVNIDLVPRIPVPDEVYSAVFSSEIPTAMQHVFPSLASAKENDALLFRPATEWTISATQLLIHFLNGFKSDSVFKKSLLHLKRIQKTYLGVHPPDLSPSTQAVMREFSTLIEMSTETQLIGYVEEMGRFDLELFTLFGRSYADHATKSGIKDNMVIQKIREVYSQNISRFAEEVDPAVNVLLDEEPSMLAYAPSSTFIAILLSLYEDAFKNGTADTYSMQDRKLEIIVVQEVLDVYHKILLNEADMPSQMGIDHFTCKTVINSAFSRRIFGEKFPVIYSLMLDEVFTTLRKAKYM